MEAQESNILAICILKDRIHLALKKENNLIIETIIMVVEKLHGELLLKSIEELLIQGKITSKDITAIIYNSGPGNFTAIRISLAFTYGLILTHNALLHSIDLFKIITYAINSNALMVLYANITSVYIAGLFNDLTYFYKPRFLALNDLNFFDIQTEYQLICDFKLPNSSPLTEIIEKHNLATLMIELFMQQKTSKETLNNPTILYLRDSVS